MVDHDPWWRDLRAAIGAATASPWSESSSDLPEDGLQLAGDGLLFAVSRGAPHAVESARRCAQTLDERSWDGDAELATALRAAIGDTEPGPLVMLAADLDELAEVIDGSPGEGGGQLDRLTGEVWSSAAVDYVADSADGNIDFDDPDRWLVVAPEGSNAAYRDMTSFIATVPHPTLAGKLELVAEGRGAFRRFRDTLADTDDEFTRWHRFAADRQRGRARSWLADHGYQPQPAPAGRDRVYPLQSGHSGRVPSSPTR